MSNVDRFCDEVRAIMRRMAQLQRVLARKSDAATCTSFLAICMSNTHMSAPPTVAQRSGALSGAVAAAVGSGADAAVSRRRSLLSALWVDLTGVLGEELSAIAKGAVIGTSTLRSVFISEYPVLHRKLAGLAADVEKETEPGSILLGDESSLVGVREALQSGWLEGVPSGGQGRELLLGAAEPFRQEYMSARLERLLEPVRSIFSLEKKIPWSSQLDRIAKLVEEELATVRDCPEDLQAAVCDLVAKASSEFCASAEMALDTRKRELLDLNRASAALQQQRHNADVFAMVCRFLSRVLSVALQSKIPDLKPRAVAALSRAKEAVSRKSMDIFEATLAVASEELERKLALIHADRFDNRGLGGAGGDRRYITAFLDRLRYFREDVLVLFRTERTPLAQLQEIDARVARLIAKLFTVLIRRAALLFPVSELGKEKLRGDLEAIEKECRAFQQGDEATCRAAYARWRALLALFCLEPAAVREALSKQNADEEDVVLIICHLLPRDKAPAGLLAVPWASVVDRKVDDMFELLQS